MGSLEMIEPLGPLSFPTEATDISDDGNGIVGYARYEDRLYLWTPAGVTTVGSGSDRRFSGRTRISGDGSTVIGVTHFSDEEYDPDLFRWTLLGGLERLPGPDDADPVPSIWIAGGCSGDGRVIVGKPSLDDGVFARWSDESDVEVFAVPGLEDVTDLSADSAFVFGWRRLDDGRGVCFRWSQSGGFEDIGPISDPVSFGGATGFTARCSREGRVAVASVERDRKIRAFRWSEDGGTEILRVPGALKGLDSFAYDCSADGSVVVGAIGRFSTEAYVWIDGEPYRLLDLLADRGVDTRGWTLHDAVDCSADGAVIVGLGENFDAGLDDNSYRADIGLAIPPRPNRPPIARAGKDVVVRTTASKAKVRLDGRDSRDPDGDRLTYRWTAKGIKFADAKTARPTAEFPIGKTTVKLTVTDEEGARRTDTVNVTVNRVRKPRSGAEGEVSPLSL